MHGVRFFKLMINIIDQYRFSEAEVQKIYDQEAERFMAKYNQKHKKHPIKVHERILKESTWFINGDTVTIHTRVIRFSFIDDSGKKKTFTFMGSMFVSRSKYSKQFILTALDKGETARAAKAETSQATLHKWRCAFKRHLEVIPFKAVIYVFERMLERNPEKELKSVPVIKAALLIEHRLFPLSYLSA